VTVYVDTMRPCTPNPKWPYRESCHLFCDGPFEELHTLAEEIGLKREWFQSDHPRPDLWHYDCHISKRRLAVQHGAVEITGRQYSTMIHKAVELQQSGILRHTCGHREAHADLNVNDLLGVREQMQNVCGKCNIECSPNTNERS
jgi:hypothetical protein